MVALTNVELEVIVSLSNVELQVMVTLSNVVFVEVEEVLKMSIMMIDLRRGSTPIWGRLKANSYHATVRPEQRDVRPCNLHIELSQASRARECRVVSWRTRR